MVDEKRGPGRPSQAEILEKLALRLDALEVENKTLKEQVSKKQDINSIVENTTMGRHKKGLINQSSPAPTKPTLKHEPAYVGFEWRENCCPLCNSTKEDNIVDQTPGGRWQCRVCAKSWSLWALTGKYPYSLTLEHNDREQEYLKAVALESAGLATER